MTSGADGSGPAANGVTPRPHRSRSWTISTRGKEKQSCRRRHVTTKLVEQTYHGARGTGGYLLHRAHDALTLPPRATTKHVRFTTRQLLSTNPSSRSDHRKFPLDNASPFVHHRRPETTSGVPSARPALDRHVRISLSLGNNRYVSLSSALECSALMPSGTNPDGSTSIPSPPPPPAAPAAMSSSPLIGDRPPGGTRRSGVKTPRKVQWMDHGDERGNTQALDESGVNVRSLLLASGLVLTFP